MKNFFEKCLSIVGIVIVLLGLTPVQPVQAQPQIINTDTTWSGWVEINSDVIVQNDATLTIEPGTEVSITVHSDIKIDIQKGSLVADGVTFSTYFGGHQWTGIRVYDNADIRNSVIRDANTGILIHNLSNSGLATITGNEITNLRGKHGITGEVYGKPAYGIHVMSGSPEISNNLIHDILSGNGLAGILDQQGGSGGVAAGILIYTLGSGTELSENTITNVRGGNGGAGYSGLADSGQHGSWGGPGGLAYGIDIQGGSKIKVIGNQISDIRSGYGGTGGHGGSAESDQSGGGGGEGATVEMLMV